MIAACPAIRGRHGCGLLLLLALAIAPGVPVLSANPDGMRNFSILAFDLTFLAPLLLAAWRRRGASGNALASKWSRHASHEADGIGLRAIALIGTAGFFACWVVGPAAPADLNQAWIAVLRPLIAIVRGWSGGIAGIEHGLVANGLAGDAEVAGSRLALLWIVPGLGIVAGFLCRWATMTADQAAWQCARNRARFSGMEVLRKLLDRGIVVLFVLSLPMPHTAAAGLDPAVASLAHWFSCVAVGGRGAVLLMLGGIGLDWLIAELILRRKRLPASYAGLHGHA